MTNDEIRVLWLTGASSTSLAKRFNVSESKMRKMLFDERSVRKMVKLKEVIDAEHVEIIAKALKNGPPVKGIRYSADDEEQLLL